jgi:hypothetical protein
MTLFIQRVNRRWIGTPYRHPKGQQHRLKCEQHRQKGEGKRIERRMIEDTKIQTDSHYNSDTLHRDEIDGPHEPADGVGNTMKPG